MAQLTSKRRRRLRKTSFAIPSKRKYPINDIKHARNALARVAQHGSPAEKKRVRASVHRRFPSIGKTRKRRRTTKRRRRTGARRRRR